jgi:hypothetical protein
MKNRPKKIKGINQEEFSKAPEGSTQFNFYLMAGNDFFAFRVLYNHYLAGDISAKGALNIPSLFDKEYIVKRDSKGDIHLSNIATQELLRFIACQELLQKHSSPYLSLAVKFDDDFADEYLNLAGKDPDESETFKTTFDKAWLKINNELSSLAMTDIVNNDEKLSKEYLEAVKKKTNK